MRSASAGGKSSVASSVARDPAHLLSQDRPRFIEQVAPEEVQFDDAFGILVGHSVDLLTDSKLGAELLGNLAMEARLRSSPAWHFPPGNSQ